MLSLQTDFPHANDREQLNLDLADGFSAAC